MRIAIFGQYKTGTTALFHAIRNACAPDIRCLFEPSGFSGLPSDVGTGVLAKVILGSRGQRDFLAFERKVLIVRDPRDWLISGILFIPQQRPEIHDNPEALLEILELLRLKEARPSSVSMHQVLKVVLGYLPDAERDAHKTTIRSLLDSTIEFGRILEDGLKIKYEDFVDGRIAPLRDYLDLDLDARIEVPPEHRHVPRTLAYGNWRRWFTEEDELFFRPLVSRFMATQKYPDDWSLEQVDSLDPSHGSEYVERTVAARLGRER